MTRREIAGAILLSVILAMMISCGIAFCHGETAPIHRNGLGVVIDTSDPNVALAGSIVAGQQIQDEDGRLATSLRIHPLGSYALFDTNVVFCGDETGRVTVPGSLRIKSGNLLFIYRRAASRLINGVPCYALRGVYPVVVKDTH